MPATKRLYELTEDWLTIEQMLEDSGGEITEEIDVLMSSFAEQFEEKAESYYHVIKQMEADLKAVEGEYLIWKRRRDSAKNALKSIKSKICSAMIASGNTSIDLGMKRTIKVTKNSVRSLTLLSDVNDLPREFVIVTESPDTKGIKDAIKRGEVSEVTRDWVLENPGHHIRIR